MNTPTILDARTRRIHVGYANERDEVVVLVDRPISHEDFRYEAYTMPDATVYVGSIPGTDLRHFLHHAPMNERGWGGQVFELTLLTGERVRVRGPWSSNSDAVFAHTGHLLTEVMVECPTDPDFRFYGAVPVARLADLLAAFV